MSKAITSLSAYKQLLTQVKKVLIEGQARIEEQRVRTYWETGRLIHTHILQNKDRAEYGAEVISRLAKDINVNKTLLHRCVKFAEEYPRLPIVATRQQFSWSHYRELMTIPNDKMRRELESKTSRNNWSADELARRIKKEKSHLAPQHSETSSNLRNLIKPPPIGALHTYTTLESPKVFAKSGVTMIDCGFDVWAQVELKSFPQAVVQRKSDYTFRAYIEKTIDGDTLWANVDLGFNMFTRQKLRLNGIDSPELGTSAGARAKTFVQKALRGVETVTIVTSKSDKYDRYLADIFIPRENEEAVYLNNLLLQNNLAVRMD
jgi:hypothetical protein